MRIRYLTTAVAGIAVAATTAGIATVATAASTLTAANCFPKGTYFARPAEAMFKDINDAGKGVIKISYLGGAPAIGSPFTLVQKTSKGVFGMASCTGAYYQNVLTEVDAFKMLEVSPTEFRARGGVAYMNRLHEAKGLHYIGRIMSNTPFNLYTNKKITKPDLTGLHLRVAPIYTAFFQALGATTQRSNISQVYTYMENGTVVGFGWPITGILPDWHKVTKYRVDPGFYSADLEIVVPLSKWKGLSGDARAVIEKVVLKHEKAVSRFDADVAAAVVKQAKDGIETITFSGADRAKWLKAATAAGWANIVKRSPKHGPKLKELFTK
jgi:TRAP-type C4-dicarboxylate transport system substrate-binding protein